MGQLHPSAHHGFTLLEMAVVISVIALLIGGILAGMNLMRAAEIRSIIEEEQHIVAAVNAFQDKYDALPGDMYNATTLWGELHATPATCKVTAATGTATCNGNGDGKINEYSPASYEYFRFWQHLANAGMYEGQYTGIPGTLGIYDCGFGPGGNTPPGKIAGAGYGVYTWETRNGVPAWFDGVYNHTIISGPRAPSSGWIQMPVLTAAEMRVFDQKYDDGRPATGKIRVNDPQYVPYCVDSDVEATAQYRTDTDVVGCNVMFPEAF